MYVIYIYVPIVPIDEGNQPCRHLPGFFFRTCPQLLGTTSMVGTGAMKRRGGGGMAWIPKWMEHDEGQQ